MLPTLAAVSGSPIPESFPGREPTPLAGISLAPVLSGQALPARPPIHFLFASDRGLRIGDWKVVSLRRGPWDLYNLARDRTELENLAASEPGRLQSMSAEWHRMTRDVLHAPVAEQKPVDTVPSPIRHPEWSDYSNPDGPQAKA